MDKLTDISALSDGQLSIALDVGANVGQTVRAIKWAFPKINIYAFEPVPAAFVGLLQTQQSLMQVECFQTAMGAAQGQVQMTASASQGTNSVLTTASGINTITVNVDTIDAFCERKGLPSIDLLKIDTEGYEMEVLKGASKMLNERRIRFVLAECEFQLRPEEPHGDFFQIAAYLQKFGYRLVATYAEGVDGSGWKWGDALFMLPVEGSRLRGSPYG